MPSLSPFLSLVGIFTHICVINFYPLLLQLFYSYDQFIMSQAPDTGGLQAASKSKIQNLLPFHNLQSIQCPKCNNVASHFEKSIISLPPWCLKLSCGNCSHFWYVCTMCHGRFHRGLQLTPEDISSHASVHVKRGNE